MKAQDVIRATMDTNLFVLKKYLSDLSDADLMRRPGPGCNHLAWQLGHLISSQVGLTQSVAPQTSFELPAGFAEQHSKDAASSDDPAKFRSKQEYVDLLDRVNAASQSALATISEADLDQPGPEHFRPMFPTVGSIFILIAGHPLMHAGQFVPVRRALGKPVVI